MNRIDEAAAIFYRDAREDYVALAKQMLDERKAEWIEDPMFDHVFGLVPLYDHSKAYVIVYLEDEDWECSEEMDTLIYES